MIPATVAAPPSRIIASPYARRLARERGVPLPGLTGSGPEGRIVAADVPLRAAPVPPPPPSVPVPEAPVRTESTAAPASLPAVARRIGAFAATLDMAAVGALLAQIAGAAEVTADDLLLKAIGRAMATIGLGNLSLTWREAGRDTQLGAVQDLSPSVISRRRRAPEVGTGAAPDSAVLVTRVREAGVRPIQAALDPQSALRLTVVGVAPAFEILLTFDEDRMAEDRAARFLAVLREGLEVPLRLLV